MFVCVAIGRFVVVLDLFEIGALIEVMDGGAIEELELIESSGSVIGIVEGEVICECFLNELTCWIVLANGGVLIFEVLNLCDLMAAIIGVLVCNCSVTGCDGVDAAECVVSVENFHSVGFDNSFFLSERVVNQGGISLFGCSDCFDEMFWFSIGVVVPIVDRVSCGESFDNDGVDRARFSPVGVIGNVLLGNDVAKGVFANDFRDVAKGVVNVMGVSSLGVCRDGAQNALS